MTAFLDDVLRGADALAARDARDTLSDGDLLRRFTTARDQSAFALLVRRHGPLVWGVCRNLLSHDADAEDAFQATFLALARGAGRIRDTAALGGWLHGVAYRVSLRARRAAGRRKRHEAVAAIGEAQTPIADGVWDELQTAVHEEVCRLPDRLRLPFVLCTLQGLSRQDAADRIGWTTNTVSVRLSEARQRLLDRLTRRGVPAAAVYLGAMGVWAAVPSRLCAMTAETALTPDQAAPAVLSLARGASLMARTKLVVGLVIVGTLTTGLVPWAPSTADTVGAAPAVKASAPTFIDLQAKANQPLADDVGGRIANNTLASVPTGEGTFAGVKFKVGEKCVQLGSPLLSKERPDKVEGITVNRRADKLHFLHTTFFGKATPVIEDGTTIAEYRVRYEDDTTATIPIKYGEDVRDWWYWKAAEAIDGDKVKVAWEGENEATKKDGKNGIRLYLTTWTNPQPGKKVVSIDFARTEGTPASPVCVAITAE
jgi:RNA polymerase sigma factor (sigma-70 family)